MGKNACDMIYVAALSSIILKIQVLCKHKWNYEEIRNGEKNGYNQDFSEGHNVVPNCGVWMQFYYADNKLFIL